MQKMSKNKQRDRDKKNGRVLREKVEIKYIPILRDSKCCISISLNFFEDFIIHENAEVTIIDLIKWLYKQAQNIDHHDISYDIPLKLTEEGCATSSDRPK